MRLLALLAVLLACASGYADEVDATALPPWTYTDGSPLDSAISYLWRSGCVRSGQYERPIESSVDPKHTYKGLPDAVCYFRVSVMDAQSHESTLSDNEVAWDGIANRVLPPTPTQPPRGSPSFALVVAPAALVTQIAPARYQLDTLRLGGRVFTDRTYTWTSTAGLDNAALIVTANDDKTTSTTVSFTLTAPAAVYVLHDPRIPTLPSWLASWSAAGQARATDGADGTLRRVLRREFPAGVVSLGPNGGTTGNMYSVAVVPK